MRGVIQMDELEIKTHDFEASKNHLKKFSEETVSSLEIKKVIPIPITISSNNIIIT